MRRPPWRTSLDGSFHDNCKSEKATKATNFFPETSVQAFENAENTVE
jgi:hypothetical protein